MDQWLLCVSHSSPFWMGNFTVVVLCLLHHGELYRCLVYQPLTHPPIQYLLCDVVLRLWKPHFCFASLSPGNAMPKGDTCGSPEGWKRKKRHYTSRLFLFVSVPHQPHWKWQFVSVAAVESILQFSPIPTEPASLQLLRGINTNGAMSLPQRLGSQPYRAPSSKFRDTSSGWSATLLWILHFSFTESLLQASKC